MTINEQLDALEAQEPFYGPMTMGCMDIPRRTRTGKRWVRKGPLSGKYGTRTWRRRMAPPGIPGGAGISCRKPGTGPEPSACGTPVFITGS